MPTNNIARTFADTYFVLDFDRCLGATDKFHAALEAVIEEKTGISTSEIKQQKQAAESAGTSFDTISYVRAFLAKTHRTSWRDIYDTFIARAQSQDTLEPHAKELLRILDDADIPYGILTHGRETWQLAKLEGAGLLDVPHLVTRIKEKGQILTEWKHKSDKFIVPPAMTRNFVPLRVASIVFLDDKAISFHGMPSGVRGVRVLAPSGGILPVQEGEIPANVTDVKGIAGAIDLLFS